MVKAESPFLIVNPKSYLYGQKSLELALAADKTAAETGLQIFFTCPFADIRLIKENTGTRNGTCASGISQGSRSRRSISQPR